jgi:arylsulfatase A-like enzyme
VAPNILLVVLDALRRDAVEPYGAPAGATPAIAQLAARGAALPNAYATGSWTLPSHASMFTGLLPRRLGLGQAPGGTPQSAVAALEQVGDRVLANVLARAGYATKGWSTNMWVSPHSGFDLGFEEFAYVPSQRIERSEALLGAGRRARLAWALDGLRSRFDDGAASVGHALRASIEAWSGLPTMWFVNLCECHSPYLPPRPWDDLSASDRVRAALEAQRHLNFESICLFAAGRWEIPPDALARMRHLYARAAAYMDSWLAGVLEALDDRGILDQTLVIVTSDHGESFGEAGLIAHGFSLDQRLIHVPFVLAGPGSIEREGPFSLAELPRLIADAAGLERHPWLERELPEGVAVAQYDPISRPEDPRLREFARRWQLDEDAVTRLTAGYSAATDGLYKLVVRDGAELVYDLSSDPDERTPLDPAVTGFGGDVAALRMALEGSSVRDAPAAVPAADVRQASEEELAAIERQMKLLGYM